MLSRLKKFVTVDEDTSKKIKQLGPLLLLVAFIAYLLFGAASFCFFEKKNADSNYRQHFVHLAAARRQHAHEVSQKIFNDTKNLFVIMDLEHSNRVQSKLINSLRDYEKKVNLPKPVKDAWSFSNSFSYAWGLTTTLGHSTIAPTTIPGHLFALLYAVVGVPFFLVTVILIAYRIFQLLKRRTTLYKRHLHVIISIVFVVIISIVFGTFLIGFAFFLYCTEIQVSFWKSLYVTILSSFSIHTLEYASFSEADKLVTHFAVSVSMIFGVILLFYSLFVYEARESAKVATEAPPGEIPRYQVIVSSDGETKIQPAP